MAGQSTLDRVDGLRDRVAELWADGASNKTIAETVHSEFSEIEDVPVKNTIINWRHDEQVKNKIHSIMRERVSRIVRRTDSELISRLENADELTVKEIIDIRKEIAPARDVLDENERVDPGDAASDLFGAAMDDPELAKRIASEAADAGE
jgi:hypothetical protein